MHAHFKFEQFTFEENHLFMTTCIKFTLQLRGIIPKLKTIVLKPFFNFLQVRLLLNLVSQKVYTFIFN